MKTAGARTGRPWLAAAALLALLPACKDDAYAVVSVLTYADSVAGVAQFRVHVDNGLSTDTLKYPQGPTEALVLDTTHPVTFSVQFDDSRGGPATFGVEALDRNGVTLGYGESNSVIDKGKVFQVTVLIVVGTVRPERGIDAGTLACDPYAPASACGAGRTCGLLCNATEPAVGMCYAAGTGEPGASCADNSHCSPGSQCFSFTAVGCEVMTCLRFCSNDTACPEQGTHCNIPITCGSPSATFHACSRPCDPTGSGTVGCATGLACFFYADETTDCACPGLGGLGAPCTKNQGCGNGEADCAGCAAGYSCVIPTNSGTSPPGVCRPICDLAAPSCPTGTTCNPFTNSTRKQYGFCQ
jgi:hypothetical protein